jgi:RimJ/RimL family protein N-acetyltransferase
MSELLRKAQRALALLRAGEYELLLQRVRVRLRSSVHATGLRRDLSVPVPPPDAKIPLRVRPFRPSDRDDLLAVDETDEGQADQRRIQRELLDEGFGTCYVAVDEEDRPCYMQLLIGPEDNEHLQRYFRGTMPWLEPGTALLEGAYTNPRYRGMGIMAAAMARIAERGTDLGARTVVTFVHDDNVASLKGCARAGFTPYTKRVERHLLLRRTVTFTPLPEPATVKA